MIQEIYLAGGCFWGVEKYLSLIEGVLETSVGYANGATKNPSYEDVCYRDTGHAEAVKVVYDTEVVSLKHLLEMFYKAIDPTAYNRQGNDRGPQYRSGIYYTDTADLPVIQESLLQLGKQYSKPLVIEARMLQNYYEAESYHQNYLDKNPRGYCHIGAAKFEEAASTQSEV